MSDEGIMRNPAYHQWKEEEDRKTMARAVRAFAKVWVPIGERLDMAAHLDAQFDGGEWSGPANARHEQLEHLRVLTLVAEKFKISVENLEGALMDAAYHEADMWFTSKKRAK